MHAIHGKLHNPLTLARDVADRARLELLFPDLSGCPEPHFLALRRYVKECPDRFFNHSIHALMLDYERRYIRIAHTRGIAQEDRLRDLEEKLQECASLGQKVHPGVDEADEDTGSGQ